MANSDNESNPVDWEALLKEESSSAPDDEELALRTSLCRLQMDKAGTAGARALRPSRLPGGAATAQRPFVAVCALPGQVAG